MNALLKENKYDLVITESTAFIERNSHLIRPYQFRAQAYLKVGKYDLAIYDYQAALRKSPENGELQRLLNFARRMSRSEAISC